MRVLLVEDDLALGNQIRTVLEAEGRAVDVALDGEEGKFLGETESYDLVILDLGLPKQDGLSILREWRDADLELPVLILTARDGWSERVDGLDAGADDYLTKPFHMEELLARVRALIRRGVGRSNPMFRSGPLTFDTRTSDTTIDGEAVELTLNEIKVLSYLVHNAGRYVTQTELSEHIYGYDGDRDSNTIAVFIGRLRKKLGKETVQSVRGRGYMIEELE